MPKFKNVWHEPVMVVVDGFPRHVNAGEVIDVPADEAEGFAVQVGQPGAKWAHASEPKHSKHSLDKSDDDRKAE